MYTEYKNTVLDTTALEVINGLIAIRETSAAQGKKYASSKLRRVMVTELSNEIISRFEKHYAPTSIAGQWVKLCSRLGDILSKTSNYRAYINDAVEKGLPKSYGLTPMDERTGETYIDREAMLMRVGEFDKTKREILYVMFAGRTAGDAECFHGYGTARLRPLRKEIKAKYKEEVERRSAVENRVFVPFSEMLKQAVYILENLENSSWASISCALALVTGRRMVEIHRNATFSIPTDEDWKTLTVDGIKYTTLDGRTAVAVPPWTDIPVSRDVCVTFTGRAKAKLETALEERRTFPVHCDPMLVIKGHEELRKRQTRTKKPVVLPIDAPAGNVNDSFSKSLSMEVKAYWSKGLGDDFTYHKFRALYFNHFVEQWTATINAGQWHPRTIQRWALYLLLDSSPQEADAYTRYKTLTE
jgi:hypothetical protein